MDCTADFLKQKNSSTFECTTTKLKRNTSGDATIIRLDEFNVKQELSIKTVDPQLVLISCYPSLTYTIRVYASMWNTFVVFTT